MAVAVAELCLNIAEKRKGVGGSWLVLMSLGHTSLWASIVSLFASSIGCSRSVQMREQSINRGCMARLGCLLQWRPGRVQASRIGTAHEPDWCLALAWLSCSTVRVNALSHRFQHPLPPLPLHSTHSTHSTSQLLPSFTRRVDVMNTSSSFQHLHLHIPIQNPHLYEIGACYAGGPRSQQFLIQLFAVTPTRARREVPASWGPSLQAVPFLTVLCFRD